MRAWFDSSFKNRIFAAFMLATLLPLLLCGSLMLRVLVTRSESRTAAQAKVELDAASERFGSYTDALNAAVHGLAESTIVRSTLRREVDDSKILYQFLYNKTENMRAYARFGVYDASGRCLYDTMGAENGAALTPDWGVLYAAARERGCVMQSAAERGMLCAEAVRTHDGDILGYIAASTDQAGFDALLADAIAPTNDLLIFDRTWRGLYYTQASRAESLAGQLRTQLMNGRRLTGGEEDFLYTVRRDAAHDVCFVLQQPNTYTSAVMNTIYSVSAASGLLCVLLCIWCAWALSRYLSEPVKKLDEAMGRVEKGDYGVKIENNSEDELGRLSSSFNRMVTEYRDNLDRSVQRERELNETQLSMLQAQLNPHFLYNTLDCIKWMGVTNGVPQIAEMTADLAALLRAGISGDSLITLERELELISQYLEIQEIRFEDRFTCEIDIEERFQHCVLPKLILQPLVENAIIHGVSDMEDGYIKVSARSEGGDMIIVVSDNGRGMPEEKLRELRNGENTDARGHLGLRNVDRIVRLYYGESYGLRAQSEPGRGTSVELRLPMRTEWGGENA